MKHIPVLLAIILPATIFLATSASAIFVPSQAAPTPPSVRNPVIIELFTSEGCSSCPPADTLLKQLDKTQPVPGAEIIALGEHVDYWNHGGWADRFSSSQFSTRQNDYSKAIRRNTVYTPQMIVDGQTEFVGSDSAQALSAIARAARQPKADVTLSWTGTNTLAVQVDHLPVSAKNDPAEVMLAITEDGLSSAVGGGENSGRHLSHSAVVRQMTRLGEAAHGVFTASPTMTVAQGWRREKLHAVVFVQERVSRRIVGAAQVAWE